VRTRHCGNVNRSLFRFSYYRVIDSWYHHLSHARAGALIPVSSGARSSAYGMHVAAVANQNQKEPFHTRYILRKRETLRILVDASEDDLEQMPK